MNTHTKLRRQSRAIRELKRKEVLNNVRLRAAKVEAHNERVRRQYAEDYLSKMVNIDLERPSPITSNILELRLKVDKRSIKRLRYPDEFWDDAVRNMVSKIKHRISELQ